MERDEMIDTVIASHSSTGSRRSAVLIPVVDDDEPYTYLVAKNASNEGIYLVWSGAGSNTDLTEEAYEAITEEAVAAGLLDVYHVYSRRSLIVTDDVVWYQIPDRTTQKPLDVNASSIAHEMIKAATPAAPAGTEPGEWHVIVYDDGTTSWAPILPETDDA